MAYTIMEKTGTVVQHIITDKLHREGTTTKGHVICWCWSIEFHQAQSQLRCLPRNARALHASHFYADADFILQQDLFSVHTAKHTNTS